MRLLTAIAAALTAVAAALAASTPVAQAEDSAAGARPAGGGARLLEALETAPVSLVGHVGEVRRIDARAFACSLRVTAPLTISLERGTLLHVAWEELASTRPPRLAAGDRILVSLEKLPGSSLWKQRLPDADTRAQTLTIAMRGGAFLKDPGLASIGVLEHYLPLSARDRDGAAGVSHLVRLAAKARPPLASGALERLGDLEHLSAKLGQAEAGALVAALLREDTDDAFRSRVLDLIGDRRLEPVRAPLAALISGDGGQQQGDEWLAPAIAFRALGRLDDSLPEPVVETLLARPEPDYRSVGARFAPAQAAGKEDNAGGQQRLLRLLRDDPAPAVRAAAVTRLVALRGQQALEPALAALSDPDRGVRTTAARQLASLGEIAVPKLHAVVDQGSGVAAQAAIAALHLAGPLGRRALAEIAEQHADPGIRTLARLALGGLVVDAHDD